mgnify:CR=1 FL=1
MNGLAGRLKSLYSMLAHFGLPLNRERTWVIPLKLSSGVPLAALSTTWLPLMMALAGTHCPEELATSNPCNAAVVGITILLIPSRGVAFEFFV